MRQSSTEDIGNVWKFVETQVNNDTNLKLHYFKILCARQYPGIDPNDAQKFLSIYDGTNYKNTFAVAIPAVVAIASILGYRKQSSTQSNLKYWILSGGAVGLAYFISKVALNPGVRTELLSLANKNDWTRDREAINLIKEEINLKQQST